MKYTVPGGVIRVSLAAREADTVLFVHGGSVSAVSEGPGRGSTFTIRLPRAALPPARSALPFAPERAVPCRVLLIEDKRDARETFRMMLELAGHQVLEAEEGRSGLELLRTELPDIAVIDVGLPGLDGYEIASQFRQHPQSHKVVLVALTGYGTPEARERSRAAGFDHHLIKPIDPDVLRTLMGPAPVHAAVAGQAPAPARPRAGGTHVLKVCPSGSRLVECPASWCGVEQSGSSSGS
ncbi:MAG: response regulator [Steroidobacteraceae bacterium]